MQAAAQTLCVMGLFVLYLFWFTMKKRRMRVKSRLRLERKKAGIKFYAAKSPELHYLDNAATTMVAPEVADAIHKAMGEHWANPSSSTPPVPAAKRR